MEAAAEAIVTAAEAFGNLRRGLGLSQLRRALGSPAPPTLYMTPCVQWRRTADSVRGIRGKKETNVSVYKVQGIMSDDQHMVYQLNEGLPG